MVELEGLNGVCSLFVSDSILEGHMSNRRSAFLTVLCLALPASPVWSQPSDSAAVVAAVRGYHAALAQGDSAAALRLLAPDVLIQESGGQETLVEYRSHHLPGDIRFAMAVPSQRGPIVVQVAGDLAWATSTSVTQGTFGERTINSAGVELMVLSRTSSGWLIRAIHWSSRNRRP